MGDLVIMPKREQRTYRNPDHDADTVGPEPAPTTKRKKKGIPLWVKWTGATALGAVVGVIATRKYDEMTGRNVPPEGELPPQGNPQPALGGGGGAAPFMPVFSFGGAVPGAPAAPQANPRRRPRTVAQLKLELRERQQAEKARNYESAEDAFYEED